MLQSNEKIIKHKVGILNLTVPPAVQMALRNHTFDDFGLPRLYVPAQA